MPQVRNVMEALERAAPKRFAFSFDKVGLQVGDPSASVERVAISLDRSLGAVRFAAASGCQMLISHHPLIFEPVGTILQTSHTGRTILELARSGIAFAAAHTNWDSARGGVNDALASLLGLQEVRDFGSGAAVRQVKLVVFCPRDAVGMLIDAASEAGAGVIGEYSRCAFTSEGTGTFLGSENSNPTVGAAGQLETVAEVRVEMVLNENLIGRVERAVRRSHPYEEPAFDFFVLSPQEEQSAGRIGSLGEKIALKDWIASVNARLETACWTWGDPNRPVKKVAVVGGAADSEWRKAREAGADVFLTGEVKQHVGLEIAEEGFAVVAAGHYQTEQPGCAALRDRMEVEMPEVEFVLYVPEPGQSGRSFL